MNSFWLANLSMALDGTRYLAGVDVEPKISFVDRVTVDAGPLATGEIECVSAFLGLLRAERATRLDLVWLGTGRSGGQSEFTLVTRPFRGSWRLHSTFTFGGPNHGWDSTFRPYQVPEVTTPTMEEVVAALRDLLDATAGHPVESHRQAVVQAQSILDGGGAVPSDVFGIGITGLEERRARLLAASAAISAGKLSGMGGFDDAYIPAIAHLDLVSIVGQAIAASTRSP